MSGMRYQVFLNCVTLWTVFSVCISPVFCRTMFLLSFNFRKHFRHVINKDKIFIEIRPTIWCWVPFCTACFLLYKTVHFSVARCSYFLYFLFIFLSKSTWLKDVISTWQGLVITCQCWCLLGEVKTMQLYCRRVDSCRWRRCLMTRSFQNASTWSHAVPVTTWLRLLTSAVSVCKCQFGPDSARGRAWLVFSHAFFHIYCWFCRIPQRSPRFQLVGKSP